MKRFALCLMVLVLLLTAFGCAGGYGSPDEFAPSGEFTEEPGDTPEESQENLPAAGQLTAGAWSDLDNWSLWLDLLTQGPNGQGEFAPAYAASKAYQINYLQGLQQRAAHETIPLYITDIRPGSVQTDMMKGEGHFWITSPKDAARYILRAVDRRETVQYVSPRWRLIGQLLQNLPGWLHRKM